MTLFILLLVFIGFAVALAWYLIARDHGEREPIGALWLAAGLGLVGGFGAGYLESLLVPASKLQPGLALPALLIAALAVGLIEELCKFVPLALILYKKRYFNEHTDGVIYFALAGLGFGLPENILYTLQFGAQAGIGRVLLTPFFHAAITGLVGYCFIKLKLAKRSPLWIVGPLAAAVGLHGLYDFGLVSGVALYTLGSVMITLLLSGGLFVLYLRANQLDQDDGLSAVGHNAFCRTCGFPNPRRHLYCVQCGNYA